MDDEIVDLNADEIQAGAKYLKALIRKMAEVEQEEVTQTLHFQNGGWIEVSLRIINAHNGEE